MKNRAPLLYQLLSPGERSPRERELQGHSERELQGQSERGKHFDKRLLLNCIPNKFQRDKEEEEMWISNESTICAYKINIDDENSENSTVDNSEIYFLEPDSSHIYENIPIGHNNNDNTKTSTTATQTSYRNGIKDTTRDHDKNNGHSAAVSRRPSPCVDGACDCLSKMAALLYSIDEARKKHFSSRQRAAEESAEGSSHLPSDQMPKNPDSVERIHNCGNGEKKTESNESASDRVILEKIQQLKIATKKPPLDKSASLPLPSPLIKPIFPPCRKCLKQVYPQVNLFLIPFVFWFFSHFFYLFFNFPVISCNNLLLTSRNVSKPPQTSGTISVIKLSKRYEFIPYLL